MKILEVFNLRKYFNIVMTSDDVFRGKPSPEIVLKTCNSLEVKPEDVLLVGDTDSDVLAGRAAGCIVIGININADFTINNLFDLTTLIVN